jgi:hypothetical protein
MICHILIQSKGFQKDNIKKKKRLIQETKQNKTKLTVVALDD